MSNVPTLGFIGAGNMAEAIIRGALAAGVVTPDQLVVSDPSADRLAIFTEMGVTTTDSNLNLITRSDQIVLAVKPQIFPKLASDLASIDPNRHILISIMAGISTAKIAALTGHTNVRVVRVMPNTPLLVGKGMSGICTGDNAQPGDESLTLSVFAAAGKTVTITEPEMDALTAVSGSGPAYLFFLAEAMTAAGEAMGLSPEASDLLTRQTLLGASTLLSDSTETAQELRRRVTSPGGTTEAAINHMSDARLPDTVIAAMQRAAQRSRDLGA